MRKNILLLFVPILLFFALSLPHIANAQDDSEFAGGGYGEFGPVEMPGGFDEGGGDRGGERIAYSEPSYIKELDKNTRNQNHIIEGSKGNDHKWRYIAKPVNWNHVKPYVEKTMRNGRRVLENRKLQVYRKDLEIKGHKVSVRYRVIKGTAHISTAWVN
ncbi:polymorphic toxin type 35 domain-containing protein [Sporolactobacillus pectinivorans]|uniref:polymorphic toxin type 35 domain-containing protein n=1 Tax=Sporolactobacillus pectinivorans TaxID=1591408 RepID=UPI000C268917|nr:polymorphic toxin type 35 domain-containing protein [Sporolactobacillus pectinivorans]